MPYLLFLAKALEPSQNDEITQIPNDLRSADLAMAVARLTLLAYPKPRALSDGCLRHKRPDHALQPTAQVHGADARPREARTPATIAEAINKFLRKDRLAP